MYPTSASYSQLVTDGETAQDLVIVFDNGTVLNSRFGDMVAGSASLTEYAFADTDVSYGECLSSEFTVEIPQSVMDANTVDGWARPYIGIGIEGDSEGYNAGSYTWTFTFGTGANQWTISVTPTTVSLVSPNDTENISLSYNSNPIVTPDSTTTHAVVLPPTGTKYGVAKGNVIKVYYQDYYGTYYVETIEVSGGSYDSSGNFLPPSTASGNYTASYAYCGVPYRYSGNGTVITYELCPLGYFNFDSTEAVEGVTTSFTCQDALNAFDIDAANFISSVSDIATYPRAFGNYLNDICTYLGFTIDGVSQDWMNSIGSVQTKPVFGADITLREIVSDLAFAAGCNIKMTRDGTVGMTRFVLAQKDPRNISTTAPTTPTAADVPCTRVVAGSSQRNKYTSVAITGLEAHQTDGESQLYGSVGNVFVLNYNPLIEAQAASYYNKYLSDLQNLPLYRPHTVSLTEADPSVTAGDMLFVEYESGSDLLFPVMSQTLRFEGRATAEYVTTASRDRAENRKALSAGVDFVNNYDLEKATTGKVPFNGEEDTDLDNASAAGFYDYLSSAANKPTTGGGALITIDGPSPYVMQYALPRDSGGNSTAYVRQYTSSNVWGPWEKLLVASDLPTWTDVTSTALSEADSSKATTGNLKLYACGNLRLLMGYITAVNLGTSQTTVANIASGHRPSDQVGVACAWDSARYVTWAIVGTGGALAVRSSSAYTSGNLRLNAIWLTA